MLLLLSEYLSQHISGFAVFQYLSFRGILGVLTALAISLLVGPGMIRRLNYYQIGQAVRDDGPKSHLSKSGTPTMGGALILVAIFTSTLLWADLRNPFVWTVLIVTFVFGAVGWVDDYRKVIERNPRGLPAKWKYFWQSVAGIGAAVFLYINADSPVDTTLYFPFFKNLSWQMGPLFMVLCYFVIVGSSNAVNLTDGLDGLAILPTVLVGSALGLIAYLTGHVKFAEYLHIPYVSVVQHLSRPGIYGRCRRAGTGGNAGHHRSDHPPRDRIFHHGRHFRAGNRVGHPAGGVLQINR